MGKVKRRGPFAFPLLLHFLRWAFLFVLLTLFLHGILQFNAVRKISTLYDASPSNYSSLRQWARSLSLEAAAGDCAALLEDARARLRDSVAFLPLRDASPPPAIGETNIMRAVNTTYDGEQSQYARFPSAELGGRLLCLAGNHSGDGTKNSYALAWRDALPAGAVFLPGLTFVSDSFYNYKNICHGLGAVVPFVAWYGGIGCRPPARFVLYKKGELQQEISPWVKGVVEASMAEMEIEKLERPTCFEEAVLFRHNEGRMTMERKMRAFAMMRCKARAFCKVADSAAGERPGVVRLTLLLRTGARAFKNETAVVDVFRRACTGDCRLTVAWAAKMESFCEQVRLMSGTDVLATPHGAQLSNMIFMDRNSSVMEFFPSGWKEMAGSGQFVYHWLAKKSGMSHRGDWRDPVGVPCDWPEDRRRCFTLLYKNQQLGHDEEHFFNWTRAVVAQARDIKINAPSAAGSPSTCRCG